MPDLISGFSMFQHSATETNVLDGRRTFISSSTTVISSSVIASGRDNYNPCIEEACERKPRKNPFMMFFMALFSPLLMLLGMIFGLFGSDHHHEEENEHCGIAASITRLSVRGRIANEGLPQEPAEGHTEPPVETPQTLPAPVPVPEIPELLNPIPSPTVPVPRRAL